jgi:hypothetical protein
MNNQGLAARKLTTMNAARRRAAMNIYAGLMDEIKARISWIDAAIDQTSKWPDRVAVYEFSYLQLRMVCESIALGCLIAHGDVGIANKLKTQYAADKIIAELGKLHPDVLPASY